MISINSDNSVTLSGLYNEGYINDATVTGTLKNRVTGDVITTFDLDYVSGSNGNYTGIITESVADDLTEDQRLEVIVLAVSGSYTGEFHLNEVVGYARI